MRFKGTIEQLQEQSWRAREKRHARKLPFACMVKEMEDMEDINEAEWKDWKRLSIATKE